MLHPKIMYGRNYTLFYIHKHATITSEHKVTLPWGTRINIVYDTQEFGGLHPYVSAMTQITY